MKYADLIAMLNDRPLGLMPERIAALERFLAGVDTEAEVDPDSVRETLGATVRANPGKAGAVAVIPVVGFMQAREDFWTRVGLAVSTDSLARQVRAAVADPNIKMVLFDVDSPGGVISGTPELSDTIYKLRGTKPMVAVSNMLMASAAYWAFSAADEVVGSPSSYTGSIGVWSMHIDMSAALEAQGVKVTLLSAGKYKVAGNPWEPLSAEYRERWQRDIDAAYGMFVAGVARNRKTTPGEVRGGYGEGDVLNAREAERAGLIDRVATFDETLTRFGASRESAQMSRASLELERERLELAKLG